MFTYKGEIDYEDFIIVFSGDSAQVEIDFGVEENGYCEVHEIRVVGMTFKEPLDVFTETFVENLIDKILLEFALEEVKDREIDNRKEY